MTGDSAPPRYARGVRFRRLDDGSAVLLVPEGVVNLSDSAASIAELIDGTKTPQSIAEALATTYDAAPDVIAADVQALLEEFALKTWLELSGGRPR